MERSPETLLTVVAKLGLAAIAIYTGVAAFTYVMQRDLMFAPARERIAPQALGLSNVAEVTIRTPQGLRLFSWYGTAQAQQPTFLFLHGGSGSVAQRQEKLRELMAAGFGVFLVGYPGYGGSEGSPSEPAFIQAAALAYDYLVNSGVAPGQIILYGESLGSSVAVQLAAVRPAKALILEAPMSSVLEIAQSRYPYLPVRLLVKDPFMSIDVIARVKMPLLILHGTQDSAIPIRSARRLFDEASGPKSFYPVEGAGHDNLYEFPVVAVIRSFLQGITPPQS